MKPALSLTLPEDIGSDDHNLIIANKPTCKDFDKSPSSSSKQTNPQQQFPLNLHRLIDSSSESSWGSSSSSESDITANKVRFMPIDTKQGQTTMDNTDIGQVKSENSLMQKAKDSKDDSSQNSKAISLSASAMKELEELNGENDKFSHGGARRRTTNDSVGLSLPALPTLNEFLEDPNSCDAPTASSVIKQKPERYENEAAMLKKLAMSEDFDEDLYKLAEKLELNARPIRRTGKLKNTNKLYGLIFLSNLFILFLIFA